MKFVKMHGCGNDYIYIDGRVNRVDGKPEFARRMSDRHRGIGGDGVVFIENSETAGCKMDMYNADGSRGMICGNALRCVAALTGAETVETLAGVRTVAAAGNGLYTVDMGPPAFLPNPLPQYPLHIVDMGNPHAVMFVGDVADAPVRTLGPEIERAYDGGINVEFIKVTGRDSIDMRVWERGSGETLACGSGACAAAAVAHKLGLTGETADVRLPGGVLRIRVGESVYMTGNAVKVFEGELLC